MVLRRFIKAFCFIAGFWLVGAVLLVDRDNTLSHAPTVILPIIFYTLLYSSVSKYKIMDKEVWKIFSAFVFGSIVLFFLLGKIFLSLGY